MLSQPLKVSILRSKFDIMGIHHCQKNYIIGFPCVAHAKEVQKFVGAHTKSYIQDYKMESFKMRNVVRIVKKRNEMWSIQMKIKSMESFKKC